VKNLGFTILVILTMLCVRGGTSLAQTATPQQTPPDAATTPLFFNLQDLKWNITCPKLGDRAGASVILHVDPRTQATKLLIRVPKDYEVPKHWHTANETHTIISGTFIMECEGKREELGPGGFNYTPSKMIHWARTKPDEGALLFITVDGAWDIHWVDRSACEANKGR
jgi:mannose-6-phosphate isomerase-like protein (cupin superfamily)